MKYRKRPVVIDAVQYTGGNRRDVIAFVGDESKIGTAYENTEYRPLYPDLIITTLEGDMRASVGDYIIRGVQGEYYPCKPDIFEKTYEPVE